MKAYTTMVAWRFCNLNTICTRKFNATVKRIKIETGELMKKKKEITRH